MNKKPIILIGGGGHCKSMIEVIESAGKFQIIGIVDVAEKVGEFPYYGRSNLQCLFENKITSKSKSGRRPFTCGFC